MPLFINTLGRKNLAVAICDRCKMKHAYDDLKPDRDNAGLRVCQKCCDEPDPHKKPQRKTEIITLRYPRPEEDLK